ncbi:MAG: PEGA domain-containing protein [Pseudomonadota bacterium]
MRNFHLRSLALLLSVALAFPISGVRAEGKPTLIVPPLAGASNEPARTALAAAFRDTGDVSVIEGAAVDTFLRERMAPASAPKKDTSASTFLKQGMAAYRGLDVDSAIKKLVKAKSAFRNSLSDEGAFEGLRAAQFYLAMSYLAKKERSRAREELLQALVLDPERKTRKLSEKLYSNEVRKLYDEARRQVGQMPKGDLEVSTPSGGELVYVDGKSAGAAPVRAGELPAGEHFVRVEAEGREPYVAAQTVVAGENRVVVDLKPVRKVDPVRFFSPVNTASDIDHERAAFLDEMGLALGGDIFVLLAPEQGQVSAQLYDQRSQEVTTIERDKTASGLARKLLGHLDRDGYVSSRKTLALPVPKPEVAQTESLPANLKPQPEGRLSEQPAQVLRAPNPSTRRAWYENPWLWGGVALGLGAAVGAVLLFTDVGKSGAGSSTLTLTVPGK